VIALPRIVAIDNDEKELKQIHDALVLARIPCLPIQYDAATWSPEDLSKLCVAVRVVLLDLNLLEGAPNAETITPHIAEVLGAVAPGGPYILAFWSKHPDVVDEVIARLADRYTESVVPPIHHALLDKHEFQVTGDLAKNAEVAKKLSAKIEELIKSVPVLQMLAEWESRVSMAAARTASRLHSLAAGANPWERAEVRSRIEDLLTWIAHETVGRQHARDIPGDAVDEGLHHALADELSRSRGTAAYNEQWKTVIPKAGQKDFKPAEGLMAAALNEVFHLDSVNIAKGERGTFALLAAEFINQKNKVKQVFGTTIKALKNEFIYLEGMEDDAKAALLDACKLGLLELSAACDFAQRKDRSLRYVLGALVPAAHEERTEFPDPEDRGGRPRESRHEAIYRLPPIRINKENFVCALNFRYILGLPPNHELVGNSLFRVRVPLLDEIAYRCSSHLARPGFISFH